jgi:hypothetical protein
MREKTRRRPSRERKSIRKGTKSEEKAKTGKRKQGTGRMEYTTQDKAHEA